MVLQEVKYPVVEDASLLNEYHACNEDKCQHGCEEDRCDQQYLKRNDSQPVSKAINFFPEETEHVKQFTMRVRKGEANYLEFFADSFSSFKIAVFV